MILYFIYFTGESRCGTQTKSGNAIIEWNNPITCWKDIIDVKKLLCEQFDIKNVNIVTYQRMETQHEN